LQTDWVQGRLDWAQADSYREAGCRQIGYRQTGTRRLDWVQANGYRKADCRQTGYGQTTGRLAGVQADRG
jgi:hypothetical protein